MKNYFVLTNGRVRREHNTLLVETEAGQKRPIPIEDVESLYLYGEVDLNTRVLNFLTQKRVPVHVFNYYGFYGGSYYPRDYLHSGFLLVQQVNHYSNPDQRMTLAREIVLGAAHGLLRNLSYYDRRRGSARGGDTAEDADGEIGGALDSGDDGDHDAGPSIDRPARPSAQEDLDARAAADVATDAAASDALTLADPTDAVDPETYLQGAWVLGPDAETDVTASPESEPSYPPEQDNSLSAVRAAVTALAAGIPIAADPNSLRGREGKIRERYYASWQHILTGEWEFSRRVRRPPDNEVNALISFGNGFLYSVCLSEIYRTQLTPTISYLHEPGTRRFSLALDLSEIFKPLIVDRALFTLLNKGQLKRSHFDRSLGGCTLTDAGKKLYLTALEERLAATIQHRRLHRSVSYRHLIRLECYKLVRHLTGVEPYRAFRAWW
jgi:CRISPR/Cas system-associated endonuclease Cas1